jgi:hypothetical protein
MQILGGGQKKKLSIAPCKVDAAGNIHVDRSKAVFEVMLNPSAYSRDLAIDYNQTRALGQHGGEPKFSSYRPETVRFELVLDGTGVTGTPATDVKTQVRKLEAVVYCYDGSQHEPDPVRVLWGSLVLFGRLTSLSINYTLFKPSGEPLRAKATLSLRGFMSAEEESLRANRSSPDLTHHVVVQAGDTLPLLCHRIYQDCAYYPEVARINGLDGFRDLVPGTRLYFPPLG